LQRWTAAAGWQVVGLGPGRPQFTGYATGGQSIAGSAWVDVAPTPVRRVLAGVNDSFRLQAYQNGAAGLALANSAAGFGDQCSFLEIVYDGPP
jgi:hypothetical protein